MLISGDQYQFCHKARREEKMETSVTDMGLGVEINRPFWGERYETSITHMVNSFISISSPSSFLRGTLLWSRSQSTWQQTSISQSPLETMDLSRNLLGISGRAFNLLIEMLSLLASPVIFFLLEAQEFLQVQRHLSTRTSRSLGLNHDTEPLPSVDHLLQTSF